jgi:hypothetical protein
MRFGVQGWRGNSIYDLELFAAIGPAMETVRKIFRGNAQYRIRALFTEEVRR